MLLTLARDRSGQCVGLRLPATPADASATFAKLDAISTDADRTFILRADTGIGFLDRYLRDCGVGQRDTLSALNELAAKIDGMSNLERVTFDGALTGAALDDIHDVNRIADSLSEYIFISGVTTEKELGRFLVDTGYKDFPEDVKPYLDYAAVGIEYHAEHDGAFTGNGYTMHRGAPEQTESIQMQSPFL